MDNQSKLMEKLSAVLPYLNERQSAIVAGSGST